MVIGGGGEGDGGEMEVDKEKKGLFKKIFNLKNEKLWLRRLEFYTTLDRLYAMFLCFTLLEMNEA